MDMPNEYSVAIDADHIEMTKFINRMNTSYRKIVLRILRVMRNVVPEAYNLGQFGMFNKRLDIFPLMFYSYPRGKK